VSADQVEAVKSGYAFGTPALDLGALVVDGGSADSSAPVRVPLAMLNRHGTARPGPARHGPARPGRGRDRHRQDQPDVLAQLGNRIQHALRACTPDDAKALKATSSTFPTSGYDLEEVLTQLGTGEAIVTVLGEKGAPTPVAWTRLRAPQSLMAEAPAALLEETTKNSLLYSKYAAPMDRESAYEMLLSRLNPQATTAEQGSYPQGGPQAPHKAATKAAKEEPGMVSRSSSRRTTQTLIKSAAAAAGAVIVRSIFGTARRSKK